VKNLVRSFADAQDDNTAQDDIAAQDDNADAYFQDRKTDSWDSFDAQLIYFSGAP
jgi:hypothetical protein